MKLGKYYLKGDILSMPVDFNNSGDIISFYCNMKGDSVGSETLSSGIIFYNEIDFSKFYTYDLEKRFVEHVFSQWFKGNK
jgi:hypothetical protein